MLADADFVEPKSPRDEEAALGRLLENLPPIPDEEDRSLRPPGPGPEPFDIPLP
ncbi:MAG: hypothetical protein U0900_00470 [Myxococcota bacterium]